MFKFFGSRGFFVSSLFSSFFLVIFSPVIVKSVFSPCTSEKIKTLGSTTVVSSSSSQWLLP